MPSREVQAIIDYAESTGLRYRVTDISGPGHAPNSYHYAKGTDGVGLAVDFGGVIPGVNPDTARQMADMYRALLDVAPQLAELIHAGSGISIAVKNGRRVDGASFYGPVTWADHRDHVHVAVPRGVFLSPVTVTPTPYHEGAEMPDGPPEASAPIIFFVPTPSGQGYWIVTADGAVYAFGDATFHGRIKAPVS